MRVDIEVDAHSYAGGMAPRADQPNRVIVRSKGEEAHFLGSLDDLEALFTRGLRAVEYIRNPPEPGSRGYRPTLMEGGPIR